MSDTIPQREALHLQLAALGGNEPGTSDLEIRWRAAEGFRQEFWPVRGLKSLAERVRALAGRGDVFLGAAPRVRKRGGADGVERSWSLWVDLDERDSIERVKAFTPAPSIVLLTGTPGHALALWPLKVPLAAKHVPCANKRLAHALGGDMKATDAARIIRVPETFNHKHDPPALVRCVRLELEVFEARDVVGGLPDPATHIRTYARQREASRDADDDTLKTIASSEYVPALTGRPANNGGMVRCPFHSGGEERTPSLASTSLTARPGTASAAKPAATSSPSVLGCTASSRADAASTTSGGHSPATSCEASTGCRHERSTNQGLPRRTQGSTSEESGFAAKPSSG